MILKKNFMIFKTMFLRPDSVVISCGLNLNMDYLLEKIWEKLALVRVYTKKVNINFGILKFF